MATFLFYDIETTGLNKSFDQVIQFAAIRTDLNLQEIERIELLVKLNADTVPSPYAFATHQVALSELEQGLNETEAMIIIHQWLNVPGTISLGYNTLGFDDEFLRFSFYRNLLTVYTHQYANQCSRMDLYPVVAMYFLYCQDALLWPKLNDEFTLKLAHINAHNALSEGQAHTAIVDVEATLALAKKLMHHKEMWHYICGYFKKTIDKRRCEILPVHIHSQDVAHVCGLLVDGIFGAKHTYHSPVIFLGEHLTYKNQGLWPVSYTHLTLPTKRIV